MSAKDTGTNRKQDRDLPLVLRLCAHGVPADSTGVRGQVSCRFVPCPLLLLSYIFLGEVVRFSRTYRSYCPMASSSHVLVAQQVYSDDPPRKGRSIFSIRPKARIR